MFIMKTRKTIQILLLLLFTVLCVGCSGDNGPISNSQPNETPPESAPTSNEEEHNLDGESNSEQAIDIECSSKQDLPKVCKLDNHKNSYIASAKIIYEYSDNKCRENQTWRISESLDSIETWGGCDASFSLELSSNDEVLEDEIINLNNLVSMENESVSFADIDHILLNKLQLGDYIDIERLLDFPSEKKDILIIKTEEKLLKIKIHFSNQSESLEKSEFKANLHLLDYRMNIVKIIRYQINRKQLTVNNLKGIEFILLSTEIPIEELNLFNKVRPHEKN